MYHYDHTVTMEDHPEKGIGVDPKWKEISGMRPWTRSLKG